MYNKTSLDNELEITSDTAVSDADIVPEEYQNRLINWRTIFKRAQFDIGDIANKLVRLSIDKNLKVTDDRIFKAVGAFCGRSGRTVRYYAETAAYYNPIEREEFDMLPFSHFVLARSFGGRSRDVLEYAALNPHLSENGLRFRFIQDNADSPGIMRQMNPDSPIDVTGEFTSLEEEPGENSPNILLFNTAALVSGLLSKMSKLIESLPLKTETKDKVYRALVDLQSVMPDILREISSSTSK